LAADEVIICAPIVELAFAVPIVFAGLDVHDIAGIDLALFCSLATMPEPEVTISS
jgi:hypothetical protein